MRTRLQFEPVMDLKVAQKALGNQHHFSEKPKLQAKWSALSKIALGLEGFPNDAENARDYQAQTLGRTDSKTFLGELLPLPVHANNKWGYEDLFEDERLATRKSYEASIRPQREELFRQLVEKHQPAHIFCYGKKYLSGYSRIFPKLSFENVNLLHATEDKSLTFKHPVSDIGGEVILMSHPVAHGMNAMWRIQALVDFVKERRSNR